jgi:hypothetical protein
MAELYSHLLYALGLIMTAILSGVAAWISHRMSRAVEEVNDAVNHRHVKAGPGAPKLYDALIHLHEKVDDLSSKAFELSEWKKGYESKSNPFRDADSIKDYTSAISKSINDLELKMAENCAALTESIKDLQGRPPCAIHEERQDALSKLVQLHQKELEDENQS